MYKDNKQLQTRSDDTPLFRYMDFISFYSLLRNQSLFFKRIDCYTDKLEGQLVEETITSRSAFLQKADPYLTVDEANQKANKEAEDIKKYRQWTLSSSWNMDSDESYAMWKIYLRGSGEGVAIKTTVGQLKAQLAKNTQFQFTSGVVTYKPLNHIEVGQYSVSANKRPAYAYEKEYRALVINQYDDAGEPLYQVGATVDLDVEALIDQVYISPFATSWFESMIKQLIQDKLPGFRDSDIIWSKIQDV